MENIFDQFSQFIISLLPKVILGLVVFAAFWFAGIILKAIIRSFERKAEESKREVLKFIRQTANVALLILGAVTALGTVGINVSALVAGLGLTGFALGFALKDVLSNLLAGVLVLIYRPFHYHDHIAVGDFKGVVTDIDLRYTTLESDGRKILVPNSILFTNAITITTPVKNPGQP